MRRTRYLGVYEKKSVPLLSVMFWGCLTYEDEGTLGPVGGNINSRKYTEVLDEHLWPVIAKLPPGRAYIFQEDNALCTPPERPHSGNRKTRILVWTGLHSHRTSISLKVCEKLKLKLKTRVGDIKYRQHIIENVLQISRQLSQTYINSLYQQLSKRMNAVLTANGYITKYCKFEVSVFLLGFCVIDNLLSSFDKTFSHWPPFWGH